MRQQSVAGNVERHTQKDVGAALVQLAAELAGFAVFARCDIELEKRMTGHQRHLAQVGHIPGADDDAARVRVGFEGFDDLTDLVNVPAVRRRPAAPLHAIDRAKIAVFTRPFVPDRNAALFEPIVVARALQKPQKLVHDGLEVNLLGCHQRKAFVEVETHLVAKNTFGTGTSAICLEDALRVDMTHEIFVLGADRIAVAVAVAHGGLFNAVTAPAARVRDS